MTRITTCYNLYVVITSEYNSKYKNYKQLKLQEIKQVMLTVLH